MNKRIRAFLSILTIVVMTITLCSCATYDAFYDEFIDKSVETYDTVKIGVFEPLSGSDKHYGELEKMGIELAHEVRSQCMGKDVELIYSDNESDIYVAEAKIQELISKQPAVILGSFGSVYSLIAGNYIEEAQIPAIAITNTNPLVTSNNPYYFRVCFVDSYQAIALAKYAYESEAVTQAAILRPRSDDTAAALSSAFEGKFIQMTGDQTSVGILEYTPGTDDYIQHLVNIKRLGVKAVFLPVNVTAATEIITEAKEMGLDCRFLGTDAWANEEFHEALGDAGRLIAFSNDYHADTLSTEANDEFLKAYKEKYGEDAVPEPAVALAYDAYMIAVESLNRIGTVKDGELLRKSIACTSQYAGVSGNITLGGDGDPMKTVLVEGIVNGEVSTIYVMEPAIVTLGI